MKLSFIIPFYNESEFLLPTLNSVVDQILMGLTAEVFLFDGMSTDNSNAIASEFIRQHEDSSIKIFLLENPGRVASSGFNLGIRQAAGEIVGLGGAHTIYPPTYFRDAYRIIMESGAAVVGGEHNSILPDKPGVLPEAMACLYQSAMGAGVSRYHRRKIPCFVDTVYGGFYRRSVFNEVGLFNLNLTKNQDNELNARIISAGKKIYFHPCLSTQYIQKTNLELYFRRAFLFGKYHPEVWEANIKAFRFRHVIPALFVFYLFSLFLMMVNSLNFVVAIPIFCYILLLCVSAIGTAYRKKLAVGLLTIPLFFGFHISYGIGTIFGIFRNRFKFKFWVKNSSRILFRQVRLGRYGKKFRLHKFRTMRPSFGQSSITVSGDERITKVGRFLRKTKLDELPQLWNVLKGEMSLVGPRAEVPEYVDLRDPRWEKTLSVKPGITGPIAVELRHEEELLKLVDDPEKYYREVLLPYKLDRYCEYVDQKCFWLDLKIIYQTIISIFTPNKGGQELLEKISTAMVKSRSFKPTPSLAAEAEPI